MATDSPWARSTYDYLDERIMIDFLRNLDLKEFQGLIESAEKYGIDFFCKQYREVLLETIQAAIYAYMEALEADDYYGDYDIDDLLKQNMRHNGYYDEIDTESVVDTICDFIKEDVEII